VTRASQLTERHDQAAARSLQDALDPIEFTRLLGNKKVKRTVQSGDPDQVLSAITDLLQTINGTATSSDLSEDRGTYTEDETFQ
jgi:hypothetical protein